MDRGQLTSHDTMVRRRKGTWTAGCTCGWTEESMTAFTAWSGTRRHLTETGGPRAPLAPPRRPPSVRLLQSD